VAPRAAARLESLGFTNVFEYKAGKQDWLAAGLPTGGRKASEPTIARVLRRNVPRFGLDDRAGPILESLRAGDWEWAAVVDTSGVLLGRIQARDLKDPNARARDVMDEGPSTYRPNVRLEELLRRMLDHRFEMAFVTDPDGRLRGLVIRRDIARALEAQTRAS
jgi:CBS domain-containing protein